MKFSGGIKPGEVRNPNGNPNPNIVEISKKHSTGPKTDLGKLKTVIMCGAMRGISRTRLLDKVRTCNKCPLGPKSYERFVKGEYININMPARCTHHKKDQKCIIDKQEHVKKLKTYWKIGEKLDSIALQETITYQMLEDAEINREMDILEKGKPGVMVHKFSELAADTIDKVNKLKFGEKMTSQNMNVNINLSDAIIKAFEEE